MEKERVKSYVKVLAIYWLAGALYSFNNTGNKIVNIIKDIKEEGTVQIGEAMEVLITLAGSVYIINDGMKKQDKIKNYK